MSLQKLVATIVGGQTFTLILNSTNTDDIGTMSFTSANSVTMSMRPQGQDFNLIEDKVLTHTASSATIKLTNQETTELQAYAPDSGIVYIPFVFDIRALKNENEDNEEIKYFGPYQVMLRQSITGTNREAPE